MYLAPLNYDRYFKKVFSDLDIAKHFLQDFLDVKIQSIELMPTRHKVTDDARVVEFDFRCQIADYHVIIDMQQWYKPDVIYRFYAYHSISTALQLEDMPVKSLFTHEGKITDVKDYRTLEPVITIIWMVDDSLGFTDDYVGFTLLPEKAKNFFEETSVWKNEDIENKVKDILKSIKNNEKGLQFLQKNRLIFAFQKNIVRNEKFAPYSRWFTLAEKSLKTDNEKAEFQEYLKDEVLKKLMQRLLKSTLSDEDLAYIKDYEEVKASIQRYIDGVLDEGREAGIDEGIALGIEQGFKRGIKQGVEQEKKRAKKLIKQAEAEKQRAEAEKQQAKLTAQIFQLHYKEGKNIEEIAEITKTDKTYIKNILN